MKTTIKKVIIATILTIGFSPLYAGNGHSHAPKSVSKSIIETIAKDEVNRLTKIGKIEQSWFNSNINEIEKYNSGQKWRVTFKNQQVKDMKKQTLYVFVNRAGKIKDTNYTGK